MSKFCVICIAEPHFIFTITDRSRCGVIVSTPLIIAHISLTHRYQIIFKEINLKTSDSKSQLNEKAFRKYRKNQDLNGIDINVEKVTPISEG